MLTNLVEMGQARDKILSLQLDQVCTASRNDTYYLRASRSLVPLLRLV